MTMERKGRSVVSEKDGLVSHPVLRAEGMSKQYGPVTVLSDVTLDILPGEIHGLRSGNPRRMRGLPFQGGPFLPADGITTAPRGPTQSSERRFNLNFKSQPADYRRAGCDAHRWFEQCKRMHSRSEAGFHR